MLIEVFKPIPGFPDYEVSNMGTVVSYKKKTPLKLRQTINRGGYKRVCLYEGKQRTSDVHRLVALAFIPNPENLPDVHHIDHIRIHNFAYNLEWATEQESILKAREHGSYRGKFNDTRSAEEWELIKADLAIGLTRAEIRKKYRIHSQTLLRYLGESDYHKKVALQETAIKMRKSGMTTINIAKQLNVHRMTVSKWTRDAK